MLLTHLALLGLASAAPTLLPRQEDTNYGFWDATYTTEGFATGSRVQLVAVYSNPTLESSITTTCRETDIRGVTTRDCPSYFTWSIGAPFGEGRTSTLKISQVVELGGEQVTLYGASLVEIGSGPAPKGSNAKGRIEAGIMPV
ncbi:uncharacterized protein EI97DRAFT_26312 [Westerdykella ornata]|uniref:AA1-like domain-containing protein n=1 Tax=Westerdykella ornata TaxID=318751 RepID=A0A6A6JZV3_WESOR|nr:uncharacterized protein EI97DRAFT_26312 [Westerdykella ornata]KAF2281316.1 hypothetical protein EI97DRAFT_26312 [Westerdykella ornata]